MNKQDLFTRVVLHLRQQGKASVDTSTGKCLYRAPDGCKCAVGALIPDDNYHPSIEGRNAADSRVLKRIPDLNYTVDNMDFVRRMQWDLHDWISTARDFPKALEAVVARFAEQYRLEVPA